MALFRRTKKDDDDGALEAVAPLPGREAYCRICDATRTMTRSWRRNGIMLQCAGCNQLFENPVALYQRRQPACPHCEEPLESVGFEYAICDTCGSKYELADGTRPTLFPNKAQREAMNQHGRSWSKP